MIRRLLAIALTAVALAGCGLIPGSDRSILIGGTSLTATVTPIDNTDMARIEAGYGVAVAAALGYARLPRCGRGEFATATHVCSQTSVIRTLQAVDRRAYAALQVARRVHRAGGINAISAVRMAGEAVSEFKAILAVHGVGT